MALSLCSTMLLSEKLHCPFHNPFIAFLLPFYYKLSTLLFIGNDSYISTKDFLSGDNRSQKYELFMR